MRRTLHILSSMLTAAAVVVAGCGAPSETAPPQQSETRGGETDTSDAGTSSDTGSTADTGMSDADCRPTEPVSALYDATLESVRDLDTGGRLQIRASGQLAFELLVANRDLYDASTHEQLDRLLEYAESQGLYDPNRELQRDSEGRWTQSFGSEGTFEMQFFEPSGRAVEGDVFDLESYVQGPQIEYDMTFYEMQSDPKRRNTWTVTWNERGPLHHLVEAGGTGRVPNPFVVHASLHDLAMLATGAGIPEDADFGPLRSLLALKVEASVTFESAATRDIDIEYRAAAPRTSIRTIAMRGRVPFELEELRATDGTYRLETPAATLDARLSGLSGRLAHTVEGPFPALEQIVTTFDGTGTPTTDWTCR